jgi:hypothetical protein
MKKLLVSLGLWILGAYHIYTLADLNTANQIIILQYNVIINNGLQTKYNNFVNCGTRLALI